MTERCTATMRTFKNFEPKTYRCDKEAGHGIDHECSRHEGAETHYWYAEAREQPITADFQRSVWRKTFQT